MCGSETISWDVRTKHVTYDPIPTLETIRGLAVYGPAAILFTLGPSNTVQQFDLNSPAMMVANVQHPGNLLPPSPPISLEETEDKNHTGNISESESNVQIAFHPQELSEEDDDYRSPLARYIARDEESENEPYHRPNSPTSVVTKSSVSISSSTSQMAARRYPDSVVSRGLTENTYISTGSSRSGATPQNRDRRGGGGRETFSTTSSVSMASSYRSRHKPSRLRNEVSQSPVEPKVVDLFRFTKSRLADVPYKAPASSNNSRLTNDDLRLQMLSTIFGWNKDADDLVRDEMSRHPLGSTNRILLAKWLGDIDTDIMAMGSENMTASDWMLLALSGIGGQASQHKLGRAYVQRLLESGDVHAAATIMIGLRDHNDAVEIYVSHKKYMEALILTCLCFPAAWERQEQIIRKWGEWAVQHGQQQLAIRCFACTGRESTEPWTSPSAQQMTFPSITQTVPELLSPPLSPPVLNHGPQRNIGKTSSLKLLTTFNNSPAKGRLLGGDDGQTPIAAGVTPILESARDDPATAVLRNNRSQLNTPASARPVNGGFNRNRLPSIGESNDNRDRDVLTAISKPPGDPYAFIQPIEVPDHNARNLDLARPNTASPRLVKTSSSRPQPPPSPSPAAVAALMDGGRMRNGSRTRIPEGVNLSLPGLRDTRPEDVASAEPSAQSSVRYHWPSRRKGPSSVTGSVASSVTSAASNVSRSYRSRQYDTKRVDEYVHGDSSSYAGSQARASSRDGRNYTRDHSRSRKDAREVSADRGRASSRSYTPKGGKRSPKSPVPMSPEDLINLATPKEDVEQPHHMDGNGRLIDFSTDEMELSQPNTVRKVGYANRDTSQVRASSRTPSKNGRASSRARSTDRNRGPPPSLNLRARSANRGEASNRSPSSPQPMPVSADLPPHFYGSDDEEDYRQAMEDKGRFRQRNNRSASANRGVPASPMSVRSHAWSTREASGRENKPDTLRRTTSHAGNDSSSRRKKVDAPLQTPAPMQLVHDTSGDLKVMKDERQLKKEQAARELEERRRSLAQRPSAPPIMHPDQLSPAVLGGLPSTTYVPPVKADPIVRSASVDPNAGRSMYANRGPYIGLPATPKAMRLVLESGSGKGSSNVAVPPIPENYSQASPAVQSATGYQSSGRGSPGTGRLSPKKVEPIAEERKEESDGLAMLLPSTVYSPPPTANSRLAAQMGRSMSAPPRDLVMPQGNSNKGPSPLASFDRRPSVDTNMFSGGRRPSVDANMGYNSSRRPSIDVNTGRRPSYDAQIPPPPPPPPAPPMLRELQHLAQPPPPPPVPLPHHQSQPVVYGGSSGMIEIVMDDDNQPEHSQNQIPPPPPPPPVIPITIPTSEVAVPILSPPAPPSSRNGHSRGRSSVDNSIGGRFARATERMRSASRGAARTKSPEIMYAPYETAIPGMPAMPINVNAANNYRGTNNQVVQQVQAQMAAQQARDEYRTGLHQSEMI